MRYLALTASYVTRYVLGPLAAKHAVWQHVAEVMHYCLRRACAIMDALLSITPDSCDSESILVGVGPFGEDVGVVQAASGLNVLMTWMMTALCEE